MQYIFTLLIIIASISFAEFSQRKKASIKGSEVMVVEKCADNPDKLYNRQEVLEQLAEVLNNTATNYYNAKYLIKQEVNIASVKNEKPIGFFVYDLTNESNIGIPLDNCIEFKDRHIYHFSLIFTPYSFSHIVVLEDGKLKVFKAINCKKGDRLEDVLNYLSQRVKNDEEKELIINRVKNYRKYGIYGATDDDALRCQEIESDKR